MMRKAHYLRHNESGEQPHNVVVVDTETHDVGVDEGVRQAVLTFGWAAYTRRRTGGVWTQPDYLRFTVADAFWEWVCRRVRRHTKLYVFAHNISFDAIVLDVFTELPRRGWHLANVILDDPPTVLRWERCTSGTPCAGKHHLGPDRPRCKLRHDCLVLVDTLNFFRMPLRELGASVGLTKLDMPSVSASQEQWDIYCRRDVDILLQTLLAYFRKLREWDAGTWKLTAPSQAFAAFRHRFMPVQVYIDANPDALATAREAYYGGRCECYRIGTLTGHLTLLDVNSLYPSVMACTRVPTRLVSYLRHVPVNELAQMVEHHCVVADVELETAIPVYPYRQRGRLIFPVGRFRTVLATPELDYALTNGHVTHVHNAALYQGAVLFKDYVDYFYRERLQARARGDKTTEYLAKLLLNSLYGKFGQSGRVWETIAVSETHECRAWDEIDAETGAITRYRHISSLVQRLQRESESYDSHPAIAAHVTSAGRRRLWELMVLAGREHVYYCDTDSLLVDDDGLAALRSELDASALGKLKVVGEYDYVELRGPKDYTFGIRQRVKGVRPTAEWVDETTVVQDSFRSLKGAVRDGDIHRMLIRRVQKHLHRTYEKGQVQPDGTVLPFRLGL